MMTDITRSNWLHTSGHRSGLLSLRWEHCDAYPEEHKVTKVSFDQVRDHVPADTPVVTAEQRDATMRRLRKGAQMRKRW